jgi:hypothetical protein
VIDKLIKLLNLDSYCIEASGKLSDILSKRLPCVTDTKLISKLFNSNIYLNADGSYNRKLSSGDVVTEKVFGKPILN